MSDSKSGLPNQSADPTPPPEKVINIGPALAKKELAQFESEPINSTAAFIHRTADMISKDFPLAMGENDSLYYYREGTYWEVTESWVRDRIFGYLTADSVTRFKYSTRVLREVWDVLKVHRPKLWATPPRGKMCFLNGILDLSTGVLSPLSPTWLSTVQLPLVYDPNATCPKWDQFLSEVFPGDCLPLAWEVMGSCLTTDHLVQQAIWLRGSGGNGKSTFLRALENAIGKQNTTNVSIQAMVKDRFSTAAVHNKLLLVDYDSPLEKVEDASEFKKIVGHDEIRAQHKGQPAFWFVPHCKVIMASNDTPKSGDTTYGFLRRLVVVPFEGFSMQMGVAARRQEEILAELSTPAELSGWLNRAVYGWQRLYKQGNFSRPETVKEAIDNFQTRMDPFRTFIKTTFDFGDDDDYVLKDEFMELYSAYCDEHDIDEPMKATGVTQWFAKHSKVVPARRKVGGVGDRVHVYSRLRKKAD